MGGTVLIGKGKEITGIPQNDWERGLSEVPQRIKGKLGFMSEEHHLVRNFVVRELPEVRTPLSPVFIAQRLNLPVSQVNVILEELEKHLTFLFRNEQGAVIWAYPVTVENTPHHVTFDTGEQLYAAWAADALATPFVQGQLRKKAFSTIIKTECAHCKRSIIFELDHELNYKIMEGSENLLAFFPFVDFEKLTDPSIIDAYWRKSVFFWSEEYARDFRAETDQVEGTYYNLEQGAYHTKIIQSALFAFE